MRDNPSRLRRASLAPLWALLSALLCGLVACDADKAAPEVVEKPAREVSPSGPLEALAVPKEVLLCGGLNDLAGYTKTLAALAPPGSLSQAALLGRAIAGMKALFELEGGTAVDLSQPLRFAIMRDGTPVALFGFTNLDALSSALPARAKRNVEGHRFVYALDSGKTAYMGVIDQYAVLSTDKTLLSQHRPFLLRLLGAKLHGSAQLMLSLDHVLEAYPKKVEAFIGQLEKTVSAHSKKGALAGRNQSQIAADIANMLREVQTISASVDANQTGARLRLQAKPKAGSELAQALGALRPGKLRLLSRLPKDAIAALAVTVNGDGGGLKRALTRWSMQLTIDTGQLAKYAGAIDKILGATSGDMALALHRTKGSEKLHLTGLLGVTDAAALREASGNLAGMYKDAALRAVHERMGLKMRYHAGAYRIGELPINTVEATLGRATSRAPGLGLRHTLGPAAATFVDLMNSHIAISDDLLITAYGKHGRADLEAWLGGQIAGGLDQTPGVRRALKSGAKDSLFLLYGSPFDLFMAWQGQQGGLPKSPMAITGGVDDGNAQLVIDMPTEQIRAMLGGLTKARAKQKNLPRPGP